MQCTAPGGRVITGSPIGKHLCSFYCHSNPVMRGGAAGRQPSGQSPFWTSPLACVTSYRCECQLKVRVASLGKSWEMIWQLPQLSYVTLVVLLLPQTPPLVNSKMISPESCFAGCSRPCTLPMGCCPGDSANAQAFVCLDFTPLSREKNKGSCSNQAPSQEQLSHLDYCYLPGTQEALSEWIRTE